MIPARCKAQWVVTMPWTEITRPQYRREGRCRRRPTNLDEHAEHAHDPPIFVALGDLVDPVKKAFERGGLFGVSGGQR